MPPLFTADSLFPAQVMAASSGWKNLEVIQFRGLPNELSAPAKDSHLILIHLKGSLTVTQQIEGRTVQDVIQGDRNISIVPAFQASQWVWPEPDDVEVLHLYFPALWIQTLAQELGKKAGSVHLEPRLAVSDPQIYHMGRALAAAAQSPHESGTLVADSLGTALAIHLLGQYGTDPVFRPAKTGVLTKPQQAEVLEYINTHLAQPLTVDEIAQISGLSPYHFGRVFKKTTGFSVHQFVLRTRIERAIALIGQTPRELAEIAALVGFSNQSHMAYHIKRSTGSTPSQLRS